MSGQKKFSGIIIPAITPITDVRKLDEVAVEKMFSYFYNHHASPFILGTTGEAVSFPVVFKEAYIRKAGAVKKEGSMLYAGVSSNNIDETLYLSNVCAETGVDAVAVTLPSYYVLSVAQMRQYFLNLADEIAVPLIIYNIPATTHMSIPLDLIDELSYHPNIVATKDSERSEERLKQSLALWKNRTDFSYFLGWAAQSVYALLNGSDGLIPSTGNLLPSIYDAMQRAVKSGNEDEAYHYQDLSDLFGGLYQGGKLLGESLWALKVLMQEFGICKEYVMPPLHALADTERKGLVKELHKLIKIKNIRVA